MRTAALLAVFAGAAVAAAAAPRRIAVDGAEVGFSLVLRTADGKATQTVTAEEAGHAAVTTNGATVCVVWRGHPLCGADFEAEARLTRTIEGRRWRFAWRGNASTADVVRVRFPELDVPRTETAGVFSSHQACSMGAIARPDWAAAKPLRAVRTTNPVGFQFMALLNGPERDSWYLDRRDTRFHCAEFVASQGPRAGLARLALAHDLPIDPANTRAYEIPYEGCFLPYRGDWFEAVEIYRPWARKQPWYRRARARPANALREISMWFWNRGESSAVIPPVERFSRETGVGVALDWYWWHRDQYDTAYPRYWPPREGEASFSNAVARLVREGIYVQPYVNAFAWDSDDESWADGGIGDVKMEPDGTFWRMMFNKVSRHRLSYVCGSATRFPRMVDDVVDRLACAGLPGVYLDQISCASWGVCHNPAHAHKPGGGTFMSDGYRAHVERLRRRHPQMLFSSEDTSEAFLDLFDAYITLYASVERMGGKSEPVPAFQAIYPAAISLFGSYAIIDNETPFDDRHWPASNRWPEGDYVRGYPDQFAVELARTLAWGLQPCVHNFRLSAFDDPRLAEDVEFMKAVARFHRDNRAFLADGEMMSPKGFSCAVRDVHFLQRGMYTPYGKGVDRVRSDVPAVLHGCWRAPDGRIALVLVNWTRESQPWTYAPYRKAECAGVVAPRSCARVILAASTRETEAADRLDLVNKAGVAWWRDRHEEKLREIAAGDGTFDLVLVGDSIAHFWESRPGNGWDAVTNGWKTLNLGFAGDRVQNAIWRVTHGEMDGYRAGTVVVLIGTNNHSWPGQYAEPAAVVAGIRRLLREIRMRQPEARIVLMSIFPRGCEPSEKHHVRAQRLNEMANPLLHRLADEEGVGWLDLTTPFVDGETGFCRPDLIGDSIHPSAAGYALWREALRPFLPPARHVPDSKEITNNQGGKDEQTR